MASAPAPNSIAMLAAPLRASPPRPTNRLSAASRGRVGSAAIAKKLSDVKATWASAGVVSCDNCANPRQAISASSPPSAMARA